MSDNVCYYGQHIGCPYADDPNCRRCAERLTRAVNFMAVQANTPTEVAASVRDESCRPSLWTMIAALILRVLS